MRVAWLCDFDGTLSPADVGASLIARFAPDGAERRRELLARWQRDEIGSRDLTVEECRDLRVSEPEALAFVRGFALDPGFAAFSSAALARGDEVLVVSDGFDFYIRELLARDGLGNIPYLANRARFENGGLYPEFPHAGGCGRCGNCKAEPVRRFRAMGLHTVVVGDGLSDRCGAREADRVVARGGLLEWCRREGREVVPFEGFARLRPGAAVRAC
ncbi:MAG TPA: HAD-IB family phosphatase [Candidatus Sulfotelmatobacter sp.]|nr:HAD-IB family phosphatase [Candidatus Sulfotelmatobacter sp.]